ncbi:MAG: hypothetical protein NT049_12930, partial [Planctomycetota bacterium]|nr:hypothetical protein [Planctomycetota bacterium]
NFSRQKGRVQNKCGGAPLFTCRGSRATGCLPTRDDQSHFLIVFQLQSRKPLEKANGNKDEQHR